MSRGGSDHVELRAILKRLDRCLQDHIPNANDREAVRDAVSDVSEYLLRLQATLARQQSLLSKVIKKLGIKE